MPGLTNRRWRRPLGLAGLLALLALGGLTLGFVITYADRVLPGVRVGGVDVSGLDRAEASSRLAVAFASPQDGRIVLRTGEGGRTIRYTDVRRRPDVDGMVGAAFAVGRTGDLLTRFGDAAGALSGGVTVEAAVTFDAGALSAQVQRVALAVDRAPVDANVVPGPSGFALTHAVPGRKLSQAELIGTIAQRLSDPTATAEIALEPPYLPVDPTIDDRTALDALSTAERITSDDIILGVSAERWSIPRASVFPWVRFGMAASGRYAPIVDSAAVHAAVSQLAPAVERKPRDATLLVAKSGRIVGGKSVDGRSLDVHATSTLIEDLLDQRAIGAASVIAKVDAVVTAISPKLTGEEAKRLAPTMTRLSTWTTGYVASERNGFGANIRIPAKAIDGTVVLPGATFDFWDGVGPVTRAKGYLSGGAIINGRTDPTGALGGGICSTSTTLFNAAARAGLEIVSRTAHYYYIDRYPVGLDATVFISSSGSRVTLSFRNDTDSPILIRGFSSPSSVRFDIYGVPSGRKVTFSTPIVKNVRKAVDVTEKSTAIPVGSRKRVEYPANGFASWVTRTVTDASGKRIHRDTFYSHYARVDGLTLVGVAPRPSTSPTP